MEEVTADLQALDTGLYPVARKRNSHAEAKLHTSIWRDLLILLHPDVVFYSIESGGVGALEGQRRKARGVIPGPPDMIFHWPHGWTAYIEIKTATGRLAPEQIRFHARLTRAGISVAVCRSVHEALHFLRNLGCPMRTAG